MQKKIFLLFALVTFCFFFTFPISSANSEGNEKEIDISTSPHKIFFAIKNSIPGDTFTEVLQVQNNGSEDFKYLFSNHFLTGSEKFYNELMLTVNDEFGELYKGKLKNFKKLDSRNLKSNNKEELTFSIYFPYELGNEFQGQDSEFQFKFFVEGTLGGVLPVDGPILPNTGSDMFNILAAGSVLVLTGSIFQFIVKRRNKLGKEV